MLIMNKFVIYLVCLTSFLIVLNRPVLAEELVVQFSSDIPQFVQQRFLNHLKPFQQPVIIGSDEVCPEASFCRKKNQIVLSLGKTALSTDTGGVPESYRIQTFKKSYGQLVLLSGQGSQQLHSKVNIGILYGLYDLLEQLGFRFLHPFEPTLPEELNFQIKPRNESPYWPNRAISHHTMHPLEMTFGLNGWGLNGPQDKASWLKFLSKWQSYQEWLVANKQNMVQWVLLEKEHWKQFSRSLERQNRLKKITSISHEWGIKVGVDVPIALEQQNAWRLIQKHGDLKDEIKQIKQSLDWIMEADFDFITTEMGFSEFHHPEAKQMLSWLNSAATYLKEKYTVPFWTKVHVSSHQPAPPL